MNYKAFRKYASAKEAAAPQSRQSNGQQSGAGRVVGAGLLAAGGTRAAKGIGIQALVPGLMDQFDDKSRIDEYNDLIKQNPKVKVESGAIGVDDVKKKLKNNFIGKRLPENVRDQVAEMLAMQQGLGGPQYDPSPEVDKVFMGGVKNPDILAHEIGHARGGVGKKVLQGVIGPGRLAGKALGLGAAGTLLSGIGKDKEKQEERFRLARNVGLAGAVAGQAPTLLEEARATGRAALAAKKGARMKRLKNLMPAYGTYALSAVPALALPGAAEYLRRRAAGQKKTASLSEKVAQIKEATSKDPRLTRAGVSGYNQVKRTPGHPTKSHIVVAKEGDRVKTIRFGQQGVKTNQTAGQREAFKSRHRKNISRGKMSAAYWADKAKWSPKKTKDKDNQKWVKGS